jgi:hypothetical protein
VKACNKARNMTRNKARNNCFVSILRGTPLAAAALWAAAASAQAPVQLDGPVRYTVKVSSKHFGDAQETRILRSGEVDDFTWKTVPPGGPVPAPSQCPDLANLPLDANGAMIRQTEVRLAPVLAASGMVAVQLYFHAHAPQGTVLLKRGRGKPLKCPKDMTYSQVVRFDMSLDGPAKSVTLGDGTQVAVSASAMR